MIAHIKALILALLLLLNLQGGHLPEQKFSGTGKEISFSEVDPDTSMVLRTIVADQAFIDSGKACETSTRPKCVPADFIQTFDDGSQRKNFAGQGMTYDKTLDAFIPPKPFATATLDTIKAQWIVTPANGQPVVTAQAAPQ